MLFDITINSYCIFMEAVEKKWHSFGSLGTILFCIKCNMLFFLHCCSSGAPFIVLVLRSLLHNMFFLLKHQWSFNLPVKEKMTLLLCVLDSATGSLSSLVTG